MPNGNVWEKSSFLGRKVTVKLTTLIENHASRRDLKAEHGLSFLIEDGNHRILFDAGNSGAVWDNGKKLGILPETITCAVLSHSHYDHAGGIMEGISRGLSCPLVVGDGFFEEKYRISDQSAYTYTYLGCGFSRGEAEKSFEKIQVCQELLQLSPNCWAAGRFKQRDLWEELSKRFVKQKDGQMIPDSFEDEICLVLMLPDQKSIGVVVGCSHPGIINILETIMERFPERRLAFVAGGIHLKDRDEEYQRKTLDELYRLGAENLYVNHCSGLELSGSLNQKIHPLGGGDCLFMTDKI